MEIWHQPGTVSQTIQAAVSLPVFQQLAERVIGCTSLILFKCTPEEKRIGGDMQADL